MDVSVYGRLAGNIKGYTYMEEQIEQFIIYLQQTRGLSDNTADSYRRDLRQLGRYLEKKREIADFREALPSDLEEYFCTLGREKKASTVSRHMSSVRTFYRYMVKMYLIREDVSEQLQPPKPEQSEPEVLTVEEVRLLVEQPSGDGPRQQRDRAILELLYATGIKVSELIALKVRDVNLRRGFLHCGEKGKERVIPFGNHARTALLQYLEEGREALLTEPHSNMLFVNCSGKAMSRQGVWKMIRGYGEAAGIRKEVTPHSLRHAFAVHLMENGADARSVQEMLGYTDTAAIQKLAAVYHHNAREEYAHTHPRA